MGVRYAYERTWGAEILPYGGARFRIWAPALDAVSLNTGSGSGAQPMERTQGGWFELETDLIKIGAPYLFELPNGKKVPDPASRAQQRDVHGPSLLVDPRAYEWRNAKWQGRPLEEAIIYELHIGTFTEDGTFAGATRKLDHLVELGVTAIELMPVAQFSGDRGWGYDGVLLYAPHTAYGGPETLKKLIDAAHARGLMVLLDVVYNHFGPDGNYLHSCTPEFFDPERHTPWGAAIAYDRKPVRAFFIENACYWIEEYRFDGLRLDAIDQIQDESDPSILEEIALEVRKRTRDREVHLTTEDDRNIIGLLERVGGEPKFYDSEWNDDFHHAAHVLATGESDGYYRDYIDDPAGKLARALNEGYVYQGEPSEFREGASRGEPSAGLPPTAFMNFLQNHDQVGNRALGERLTALASPQAIEALTAILLLSPHIPLLFMGEEWGETQPFYYFTDFHGDLGRKVRDGRRNEFRRWRSFQNEKSRELIPDPNSEHTFQSSKLGWHKAAEALSAEWLDRIGRLLDIRRREIVPRLARIKGNAGNVFLATGRGFAVQWRLGDGAALTLYANLQNKSWSVPDILAQQAEEAGRLLYESAPGSDASLRSGTFAPWSVVAKLRDSGAVPHLKP
jgi:maltooligosyltrehalose trehalohydrolase